MSSLPQYRPHLRKLFSRNPNKANLFRLEVYHHPYSCKIQNSRYYSCLCNIQVRNTYRLGNKKRCRTHYRRHYLPSCRCSCLNRRCKLRLISQRFHKRYCERACRYCIGNRRSRYGTLKRRSKNRNLCWSSCSKSSNCISYINEELSYACFFEECTKEYEQEYEGCTGSKRKSYDPFCSIEQVSSYTLYAITSVVQESRYVPAKICIGYEYRCDDYYRPSYYSSASFHNQYGPNYSNNKVHLIIRTRPSYYRFKIKNIIRHYTEKRC